MKILTCHDTASTTHSPQHGCDCANGVHQFPTSKSQLTAPGEAEERLEAGWDNLACPSCGHFGWLPPKQVAPVRACRVCGCTDERACPGSCFWVGPDLCSRCQS